MTWGVEPRRSRLIIVATAVAMTAVVGLTVITNSHRPDSGWFVVAIITGVGPLLLASALTFMATARRLDHRARLRQPARFQLRRGGFAGFPRVGGWWIAVPELLVAAGVTAQAIRLVDWYSSGDVAGVIGVMALAINAAAVLLVLVAVALVWPEVAVLLSTQDIRWRTPFLRRSVPWEALAPGGPPRPGTQDHLILAVIRPDLVRQRGWALGQGSRDQPRLNVDLDVHPWFLADAIRWYVEHPDERVTIGTPEGHNRLTAALLAPAVAEPSTGL